MATSIDSTTRCEAETSKAGPKADALVEAIDAVVRVPVDAAGLYLEEVRVSRAGTRSQVRVIVDLPEGETGSLDSDALTDVSRAISAALDENDVVPGAYVLEVSTPGTSRPLTTLRHFRRARTRTVRLEMMDKAQGIFVGVLDEVTGAEGDAALIFADGHKVALAEVRKGRVEPQLKRQEAASDNDGQEA